MGLSVTLYEIKKSTFDQLSDDPSSFSPDMAEDYEVFEKNFDGVLFVLTKCVPKEYKEEVRQVFYPGEYLGETIDFSSIDFDNLEDPSVLDHEPISYLSIEKVLRLKELLNRIDKKDFLKHYHPEELNQHGIYPEIWHDDESVDKAFNRRHLEEGFDDLIKIFNQAAQHEHYIFSFIG